LPIHIGVRTEAVQLKAAGFPYNQLDVVDKDKPNLVGPGLVTREGVLPVEQLKLIAQAVLEAENRILNNPELALRATEAQVPARAEEAQRKQAEAVLEATSKFWLGTDGKASVKVERDDFTRMGEFLARVGIIEAAEASAASGSAMSSAPRELPEPSAQGPYLKARGLAVGWPGGPVVAEGIDLDLRVGRRVAIVGPSGIGKSTLLATLAGLLEPRGGTLTLDGVPPWQAARSEVAARVCLTAEDAHVFHTSVLENLRVARGDVTPAEAGELLSRAGLGRWLEALPEGVETIIGTDATTLSGGERRRLLLARALAAPAPLMLLDEPGEHLDALTADRLVTDLLTAGDQGRGTLLVTHRLSALEHADEVLVMGHRPQAAGEQAPATILHRGSHRELQDVSETYRWSLSQEDQDRQQDHVSGTS